VPGSFVFISSVAGKRGEPGASAYCVSKFGLLGLVESFAAEVATQGIRANAVCPGNVDSSMLQAVARQIAARERRSREAVMSDLVNAAATGRLVDPREVASTCLWLCSPLASGVTGESVNVDGGALTG
jgi:NAD(P)-dependent dehydrogenase (short-subunit alcohol dehydrogenase family)